MDSIVKQRLELSRRRVLSIAGAAGAGGFALTASTTLAQPIFSDYPFQLGVASGDPTADGFVIWTRVAPRPLEYGYGMPHKAVEVKWDVASDDGFRTIVKSDKALARPELGHAVHVEVAGLEPGRPYWYRFSVGSERSGVGRAQTLPAAGAALAKARFGVVGCAHYEQGTYIGYRKLAGESLDFVFHYGDYIYEGRSARIYQSRTSGPLENPRQYLGDEVYSLDDYRIRYAQTKMDLDLQAAHASAPWFVTWDDHEIVNNWVDDISPDGTPAAIFNLRRQAAAQAYYEHMPLRASSLPVGPTMQIYRRASFGDLMDVQFLDTRSYRSDQPCGDKWGACDEYDNAKAEVLGLKQEKWLYEGLAASRAKWNVLAQQVMVMDLDRDAGEVFHVNPDSWGGYTTPRARLLNALKSRRVANPVILTGDEHQNFAGEVYLDGRRMDGAPIAAEFVATSVSSSGDGMDQRADWVKLQAVNPQLKFNNSQRGYIVCDVTPERYVAEFKVMDRISDRNGTLSTRAKWALEPGSSKLFSA